MPPRREMVAGETEVDPSPDIANNTSNSSVCPPPSPQEEDNEGEHNEPRILRGQDIEKNQQCSTNVTWSNASQKDVFNVEIRKKDKFARRSVSLLENNHRGFGQNLDRSKSVLSNVSKPLSRLSEIIRPESVKANIGPKNGNMVLQLVLPHGGINSNNNNNGNAVEDNYLTTSSIEEILGPSNGNNKRRADGNVRDLYSSLSNESYVNHGFASNEFEREDGRNYMLPSPTKSQISLPESNAAKSTTSLVKGRYFSKYLANILSSMYAVFIVTLGLVVYTTDVIQGNSPIAESFSLYLVIISFIFILYLIFDIRSFMIKKQRYNHLMEKNESHGIELTESSNGEFQLNITLPEAARLSKELKHHYCYSKDRHSANFYLKIGAAGFCVGHLIHSGLLLGYQIFFLTSDGKSYFECSTVVSLILDIIYPLYSFFLLYFIFKYSNIIVNRNMAIIRFGLMHCISSSLCFWMWTILREILESLSYHSQTSEGHAQDEVANPISEVGFFSGQPVALPLTSYNKRGASMLKVFFNTSVQQFEYVCQDVNGLGIIYRDYSPYLYPFSVEYSILVVGVLFVIWRSIGRCKEKEEMSQGRECEGMAVETGGSNTGGDNLEPSNIVIHADCHSANKGLFAGIVIMVLSLVSVILFFIAINNPKYVQVGVQINMSTSLLMFLLMTFSAIGTYRQITKLDVTSSHVSFLDDLLLFICIPAFFLNGIVGIIPAIHARNTLSIIVIIMEVGQVLVQTPLIIDGLRRTSNSRELRREKPGRELLSFLIVANVAMWIMQTFEVKSHTLQDDRDQFYGQELWIIIGHLCIPLMMFYRFHSSVCIADIWKYAYEPSRHIH